MALVSSNMFSTKVVLPLPAWPSRTTFLRFSVLNFMVDDLVMVRNEVISYNNSIKYPTCKALNSIGQKFISILCVSNRPLVREKGYHCTDKCGQTDPFSGQIYRACPFSIRTIIQPILCSGTHIFRRFIRIGFDRY